MSLSYAKKLVIIINAFNIIFVVLLITGTILVVVEFLFETPEWHESVPPLVEKKQQNNSLTTLRYFWTANILPNKPVEQKQLPKTEPKVVQVPKVAKPQLPYILVTIFYDSYETRSFAVLENTRTKEQILVYKYASVFGTPYKVANIFAEKVILRFEDFDEILTMETNTNPQQNPIIAKQKFSGIAMVNNSIIVTDELVVPIESLKNGDELISIDDMRFESMDSLQHMITKANGNFINLLIKRGTEQMTIFTRVTITK